MIHPIIGTFDITAQSFEFKLQNNGTHSFQLGNSHDIMKHKESKSQCVAWWSSFYKPVGEVFNDKN